MEKISITDMDNSNEKKKKNHKPKHNQELSEVVVVDDKDNPTNVPINPCDEPWNYKILLLLQKIGKKTMGYRWMHEQEALYHGQTETKLGNYDVAILALMGTVTGAGFVNFAAGAGLQDNKIFYIVISVLQLILVFLAAFVRGYRTVNKHEKNTVDHFQAALKNANLNLNLQLQLALNVEDRQSDKIFLENMIKGFNEMLTAAPPIRDTTKKKYVEGSKDNEMFNPLIGVQENSRVDDGDSAQRGASDRDSKLAYQIDRWLQHF